MRFRFAVPLLFLLAFRLAGREAPKQAAPTPPPPIAWSGWPATIIFSPDGRELAKRRGYLPPEQMASVLQAFIDDPRPGPSVVPEVPITPSDVGLTPALRRELVQRHVSRYDRKQGSWGF